MRADAPPGYCPTSRLASLTSTLGYTHHECISLDRASQVTLFPFQIGLIPAPLITFPNRALSLFTNRPSSSGVLVLVSTPTLSSRFTSSALASVLRSS